MTYQVNHIVVIWPLLILLGLIELQVLLERGEGVACNLLTVSQDYMEAPKELQNTG